MLQNVQVQRDMISTCADCKIGQLSLLRPPPPPNRFSFFVNAHMSEDSFLQLSKPSKYHGAPLADLTTPCRVCCRKNTHTKRTGCLRSVEQARRGHRTGNKGAPDRRDSHLGRVLGRVLFLHVRVPSPLLAVGVCNKVWFLARMLKAGFRCVSKMLYLLVFVHACRRSYFVGD